jgi:hypothetical protein
VNAAPDQLGEQRNECRESAVAEGKTEFRGKIIPNFTARSRISNFRSPWRERYRGGGTIGKAVSFSAARALR